jgi:glycosyltransferase involved in cell wall biosynthesis
MTAALKDIEPGPWVSVIIPTCNRAEFLGKAVASVLAQTYPYFELLVIDDGSEDETAELLASFKPPVRYIRQENRGPAAARNLGIREARHDLLAFLDSDDTFDREKLAIQVAAMEKAPEYLISHTQETWFRNGRFLNQKKIHRKESGDIFARSLNLCVVGMSTVMARRRLFQLFGSFDEELRCCEDYDLWLRVSACQPFLLIDRPLTVKDGGRPDQVSFQYRVGMDRFRIRAMEKIVAAGNLTPRQEQLAREELVRKCRVYGNGCLKHGHREEGEKYLALIHRYGSGHSWQGGPGFVFGSEG